MINQSIGVHRENRGPSNQVRSSIIQSGLPPAPTFDAPLLSSIVARAGSGSPTFTRATVASFLDWEGVLRTSISGEPRFVGARRCQNVLRATEALDGALWQVTGTATITPGQTDPLGGSTAYKLDFPASGDAFRALNAWTSAAGKSIRMSLWIKADSAGTIRLTEGNAGVPTNALSVTTSWQRMTTDAGVSVTNALFYLDRNGAGQLSRVYIWRPQMEDVTGASVTAPSEYVSVDVLSAPYHGAGVDGVKYFTTQNGNTVASNVVTEAQGAAIADATLAGYLAEGAGTQLVTPTASIRDFTGTWVLTNMTAALTTTGIDGATNSASRLTATGATATALITLAGATSRTVSCYMKRVTGTGTIKLTQGASKSSDLASSINSSTWTLVQFNASADTSVTGYGIEIGTSGDAIDVDFFQFESGGNATSRMATAGAVRNADVLLYPYTGNALTSVGTAYAEFSMEYATSNGTSIALTLGNTASSNLMYLPGSNVSTNILIGDGTATATKGGLTDMNTAPRRRASYWGRGATMGVSGDGGTPATAAFDGTMGTINVCVGCNSDGNGLWKGTIRNVRIWTTALADNQIAALGIS